MRYKDYYEPISSKTIGNYLFIVMDVREAGIMAMAYVDMDGFEHVFSAGTFPDLVLMKKNINNE